MKKTILFLLALLPAQAVRGGEVKALLGIHSSKYLFSSEVTTLERRQKTGLALGLGYAVAVASRLKLEAQAILSEKGAKAAIAYAPGKTAQGTYRNTALALPIFVSYHLREGATPYAALGPELNFVLAHKLVLPEYEESVDIADNTNKIIFAIHAALGYELPLERWGAFIEVRYNRWLSDLWKSPEATVHSESLSVVLGAIYYL